MKEKKEETETIQTTNKRTTHRKLHEILNKMKEIQFH